MYKTKKSNIKTIKLGEDRFTISDGMITVPRAGFSFHPSCPIDYKKIVLKCLEYGWLIPVAHMLDSEVMWEELKR